MSEKAYPVPEEWKKRAWIDAAKYRDWYRQSVESPDIFWAEHAKRIDWIRPFTRVENSTFRDPVSIRWFEDGTLNVSANCLDRHLKTRGDRVAILWEGDDPKDSRKITYRELHREVCRFANVLKNLGARKGDRVTIYMPMIPEAAIAMLACARIGAIHSVVFGGFSPDSLAGRIDDCKSRLIVTTDEGVRGGKKIPLKHNTNEALAKSLGDEKVLVVRHTGNAVAMHAGRDFWYHELAASVPDTCEPEEMAAEDPLFILYTSGSTGKPKGVLHTTGGYLVYVSMTHQYVFDYHDGDIYWCTADIGWVTGHSYIVYGPLANATTGILYEGAPDAPAWDRWWQIVEDYKVSILYCAPTAIRAFMKQGEEFPAAHDLSSLRVLGSVGEPINPEAWRWYKDVIGGGTAPVVGTWWQTETGQIMISPLPGVTTTKPGSATFALPGIEADVVDADGRSVPLGGGGYLVLKRPWPGMLRGIYGDPERFRKTYWSRFPGMYFAGDGAKRDEEGYLWLLGRVDDVMNVAGHRISTTEVESALVDHRSVAEAAVVGKTDAISGQAIFAFVILKSGQQPSDALGVQLREHVAYVIGPIARPKYLMFVPDLPKTRSGKIMRRLLRDIAEGRALGDVTTLADANVVDTIRSNTGKAEEE